MSPGLAAGSNLARYRPVSWRSGCGPGGGPGGGHCRHQEFLRVLKLIDAAVPQELELHLVLDNYATHKTEKVKQWLIRHPQFHLHFTQARILQLDATPPE
jgi:hypothetical protein